MSSSWRRDGNADSFLSRQSRSSAVAGGPIQVPDRPEVPKWLIQQQQQLLRGATSHPPAPHATPVKRQPEKKSARKSDPPEDDDLIMVDLLDGAHLPTRSSAQLQRMSSNSDSIISLPPITENAGAERWQALRAEAQETRRRERGGVSIGGLPPSYIRSARKCYPPANSPTQQRPRAKLDVAIPIMEPLPSNAMPSNLIQAVPSVRAESMAKGDLPPARDASSLGAIDSKEHEIVPILSQEAPTWNSHSRQGSFNTREAPYLWYEDDVSLSTSSFSNPSYREKRKPGRRKQDHFQPGIWGWRKPAEEDAIMPQGAWIYLALIGILTFLTAHCVNSVANFLSVQCITNFAAQVSEALGNRAGMAALAGLRGLALVFSFLLVLYIAPEYSMGSGIPEMKCVVSGVLMPRMLNWKTLVAKTSGLAFALSSSISIGRLGPFIHMSGILAALVSKIPFFTSLRSSARFQLQALSAAMAAGVGATFGAPIGGTMLSIEIMSTYYYIHWLPMALYCSIMGYYCVVSIARTDNHAFFSSNVTVDLEFEPLQRLFTYVVLGAVCGLVGAALVQFTKRAYLFRKNHFASSRPVQMALMVFCFAAGHTLISEWAGGVLPLQQRDGVIELINSAHKDEMWLADAWKPFPYEHWNSSISLLFAAGIKFVLTGLSLVMPVPAGTFMPIFEIGALVGRAFGELCSGFSFVNWVDVRATAIIGAAAVTAGTLHTTSVAVVMLELTREAIDVLPLTVGVIVAYAVSKQMCSDLFSELIKIRRLPFILGLRERYPSENKQFYEDVSSVVAGSFMWKSFPFVTPQTTKGEILHLLTRRAKPWSCCAFLSDRERRRLWGTLSQQTLWDIVGEEMSVASGESFGELYGTFSQEASRSARESETVPFLRDFNPSVGHPLVDMGPMQVSVNTPFWKVGTFFRMLSMAQMFVMQDGMTVGCITRQHVIQYSHSIEDGFKKKRAKVRERELRKERQNLDLIDHLRRNPPSSKRLTSRPSASDLTGLAVSRSRSRQGSFSRPPV